MEEHPIATDEFMDSADERAESPGLLSRQQRRAHEARLRTMTKRLKKEGRKLNAKLRRQKRREAGK